MTDDEIKSIIDALPDGKRKQACRMLHEAVTADHISMIVFWPLIEQGEYGKAAEWLIDKGEKSAVAATICDMIWEG